MSFFKGCLRAVSIVELPPQMGETETSKVLKLDQDNGDDDDENKAEKANNLNIEEFECGVQFEGSEHSKQEWSFTLYDFDGHGRITKEDLASLLKALYDAVGSSIRLPPNGAKTLKLRLTVGQDRTQIHAISASKALTGGKRKENGGSGSKAKTSKESPKPLKQQFSKLNNLTRTTVKVNNQTLEAASQGQSQVQGQLPGGRKHLSAEDQQQLVELVQENMERNHVKQLRRHHSDCHAPGEKPGHHHKRRHRGRSSKTTAAAAASGVGGAGVTTATPTATAMALAEDRGGGGGGCRESQDRRNYYLDLAGVDSSKLNNITAAAAAANTNPTKVCNNNQASSSSLLHPLLLEGGCSGGGHHRSRSHDVTAATMMTMTATTTTTTTTGGSGSGGGGKYDNVKRESDRLLDSGAGAGAGAPSGRGVVVGLVGFPPSSGLPTTTSTSSHHHNHNLLQHSHHLRSRSFDPQDSANPRTSKSGGGGAGSTPANNNATTPAVVLLDSTRGAGLGGSPSHKHSRFRPVSLPGGGGGGHMPLTTSTTTTTTATTAAAAAAVSPGHYHRRHRHREKDHDLAMQQVAAWIERQHAWDFDGQRSSGGSAGGGGSGGVIVQRHHHHHIHEHHHHHHYHHYYEA